MSYNELKEARNSMGAGPAKRIKNNSRTKSPSLSKSQLRLKCKMQNYKTPKEMKKKSWELGLARLGEALQA